MIEINSLIKNYGALCAVNNISLRVEAGEIFGFLGMNGAGKTTTIRMMAGVIRPSSGNIKLAGFDIVEEPIQAKKITGYIPDRPYIYNKLTGREFLYFVADLYQVSPKQAEDRIDQVLDEYRLTEWENELVESYSHGMKQRLATCAALIHDPKILILDEPMVGLDPHGAKLLKEALKRYAAKGIAVFLSTHSLNVAEELAQRLAIIHKGSIIATGSLEEIRALSKSGQSDLEDIFLELTSGAIAGPSTMGAAER